MYNYASTTTQAFSSSSYTETVNMPYVAYNGTYTDTEKYYNFIYINKIYTDREYIYDLYSDNKYFGESEHQAEKNIIKQLSVPLKGNFLDYYD